MQSGSISLSCLGGEGTIDYGDESELTALRYTREQVELWVTEAGFITDRCKVDPVEEMPMDAIYLEASKP